MALKSGKLVRSAALAALISAAAAPAGAADIVYAWANNATAASYDASPGYAYSPGKTVKVTRTATGRYSVNFGQNAGPGANVQVVAYGAERGHCNVMQWSGGVANVMCIDGAGQTADRRFLAMAVKAGAADSGKIAYAWLHDENAASYAASAAYRFGPGSMQVTRTGVGRYLVNLGAPVGPGAAVLVTAYDSRGLCNVVNWGSGNANIACKGYTGDYFDTKVSVLAIGASYPGASFVWNSAPAGQASAQYSHSSDGSAQSVTRNGTGDYTVALGPEAGPGGHVQVTAYSSNASCWVSSYSGGNARVLCATNNDPQDSRFVAAAFKGGGTIVTPIPGVLTPVPAIVATPTAPDEDCIGFSNANADLKQVDGRWKIVDGAHWMFDFDTSQVEGALSLNIIKNYGANAVCYVGRPNPSMTYLLKDGAAPQGATPGEDCVAWNLASIEAKYVGGQWKLVDGSHWILGFPNEAEAQQALAIVKYYGFTRQCFVGRPDPSFVYFRK